jgi:hypothetical protein
VLLGAAVAGVDRDEQRLGRRLDLLVLDHAHGRNVVREAIAGVKRDKP